MDSVITYVLWIAPAVLQGIIAGVMVRRKLYREFPMFLLYTGFQLLFFLVTVAINFVQGPYSQLYFYTYWAGEAVSTILRFLIIREIVVQIFQSYAALRQLGFLLFRWAAALLLLVAAVMAASSPGADADRLINAILLLERTATIVQCGLLFLLFLFSSYFNLSWRHYALGIALGFGIFASVNLAALAIRAQVGGPGDDVYGLVYRLAYNCAVLVWISYLLVPEPAPRTLGQASATNLEKWNQELLRLLQR